MAGRNAPPAVIGSTAAERSHVWSQCTSLLVALPAVETAGEYVAQVGRGAGLPAVSERQEVELGLTALLSLALEPALRRRHIAEHT